MLQPTSRRFLRELDEASEGNNLQYIYYSILAFWFLHSLVTRVCTMKSCWEATGGAPGSCVRGSLTIPSRQYSSLVKWAMNWGLRSEITYFRRPWSFQTWCKKSLAAPSAVTVMCIGMKCTRFNTESTTVITALCLEEKGSSTIKSTLSMFHCKSGIWWWGSKGLITKQRWKQGQRGEISKLLYNCILNK